MNANRYVASTPVTNDSAASGARRAKQLLGTRPTLIVVSATPLAWTLILLTLAVLMILGWML